MNQSIRWKILCSCICFLVGIYALASIDTGYLKKSEDTTSVMSEEEESDAVLAENKIMYLTFDDGPSDNTQAILDILGNYDIKATFFITGQNENYFPMIKRIYDEGHVLGVHTYTHNYKEIYASVDAYLQDIQKVQDLIKKETGVESHILRFPGGSSNTISKKYSSGIMNELVKQVEALGYQYYDWNAHNGDGNTSLSEDVLLKQALKDIEGKNEVMLLMHDGTGNANTVESLDTLLQELIKQGWQFRVIEENSDMPIFHHHISN